MVLVIGNWLEIQKSYSYSILYLLSDLKVAIVLGEVAKQIVHGAKC